MPTPSPSAPSPRRAARLALAAAALLGLCAACAMGDDDGDDAAPEPPAAPPAQGAAEGIASSTSAPALDGAYQITWMESQSQGRTNLPADLLRQLPGCFWGRWLVEFRSDGSMRFQNELLCRDPFRLRGDGYGVCVAEAETDIWWAEGRFRLPVTVRAHSQMQLLHPSGNGYDRVSAGCDIRFTEMQAQLTELEAGERPNRPRALVLDAGGLRMRLEAVDDVEVSYADLAAQQRN